MPKRDRTQDQLDALAAIADGTPTPEDLQRIRTALEGRNAIVCAKAAEMVAEGRIEDCLNLLVEAFDRFMTDPVKRDPGCRAKIALVNTLNALESDDDTVFLRGIRHVQQEPVFGGRVDTAANLRANCAVALARADHPQLYFELARLLVDAESHARSAAARVLGDLVSDRSALLLRMKALTGDAEPSVVGECLLGLMRIAADESVNFVAEFLDNPDIEVAEQAALALGEARTLEAFRALQSSWQRHVDQTYRRMLALSLALTRRDEAFDLLVDIVRDGHPRTAERVLEALRLFDDGGARREVVREVVSGRGDADLDGVFARLFPL
ncbi:MAG TPA: hypothetical protein PK468_16275 [Candidatus Hydrogenedentes bacterium]|nr:hypothetical protein [Candidatus Hydrogenedentota bacterium]